MCVAGMGWRWQKKAESSPSQRGIKRELLKHKNQEITIEICY